MNDNTTEYAKKAGSFIAGILTGWGVPANWARVITGAIIGAAIAAATCLNQSCTLSYSARQDADGARRTSLKTTITLPQPVAADAASDKS